MKNRYRLLILKQQYVFLIQKNKTIFSKEF